jgi:thioredoxin-related protein
MSLRLPSTRPVALAILTLVSVSLQAAWAKDFDDSQAGHIDYPNWFEANPFNDLQEVLDEAGSNGKKGLMVLFTTEGCSYCARFIRKSLGDPGLASEVQANFAAVGLEIFDDREMTDPRGNPTAVKQFAQEEGAEFAPTLLFYGKGGKRLFRQVGYQSPERFQGILHYLVSGQVDKESLRDYFQRLAEQKPAASANKGLKSDPLFGQPPYALDRSAFPAEQPLLLIFEKPGCAECEEFHTDVLALQEVRDLLGRFEIVRLDADDEKTPVLAPDGVRTTPAAWFNQTAFSRLPALVFFDEKGNEVLKTDALVKRSRMLNSLNFVLQRAYEKGWTYQRFARTTAIEKLNKKQQ